MTRPVFLVSVALTLACGRPAPAVPDLTSCQAPGIPHCVSTENLILSGQPTPEGLQYLAGQGYTTVISTRGLGEVGWDERAVVESLGMRFVEIPMANPVREISDAEIAALDSLLGPQHGPTLLHCASGNRAAGLWGAWLAEKHGVDRAAALNLAAMAGMTGVRPAVERRIGRGSP